MISRLRWNGSIADLSRPGGPVVRSAVDAT
jgi:hypothetical protein